jgi:hypothetical protein
MGRVRSKQWLGILLAAGLLAPGTALSVHEALPSLVDAVPISDSEYVAWRVHAPAGAHIGASSLAGEDGSHVLTQAFWFVDAQTLQLARSNWFTGFSGMSVVHVGTADGTVGATLMTPGAQRLPGEWWETYTTPFESDWLVVALVAADGGTFGELRLHGSEGVAILGRSTGPSFLNLAHDFEGASIIVQTLVSARLIDNATLAKDAAGLMFAGFYGDSNSGDLTMSIQGPQAHSDRTGYLLSGEPAGRYTFRIDHNLDTSEPCHSPLVVDVCSVPDIWLFGADVTLP